MNVINDVDVDAYDDDDENEDTQRRCLAFQGMSHLIQNKMDINRLSRFARKLLHGDDDDTDTDTGDDFAGATSAEIFDALQEEDAFASFTLIQEAATSTEERYRKILFCINIHDGIKEIEQAQTKP